VIIGQVSADREPVILLRIQNTAGDFVQIPAVIDTGFTEFLTVPPAIIVQLGLPYEGEIPMMLAADIPEDFDQHSAWVEWDGAIREVLALRAEGVALVGMGMLRGYRLTVDGIDGGPVTIEALQP
jgi:predicted aspartyl protease